MELTIKQKLTVGVSALLVSFAAGRYTVPEKIKIETKTVEVEKKVEIVKKDVDKDAHKKIITVVKYSKTGKKESLTTTVEEDTKIASKTGVTDNIQKDLSQSTLKITEKGDSKVTISALAGVNPFVSTTTTPNNLFIYGASIYKPVLGPIGIGIFGLSNGSCGASVGVTF